MSELKSIAIVGASGNLGSHVFKALVQANFQVTVLTRSNKPGAFDGSVKVVEVDFTSVESLTAALKGIDGLVSTITTEAVDSQTVLIDAAAAAGVKRFIPSEYGSCSTNPKLKSFPIYSSMFKIREQLQEKAEAGQMTWTVLACGAFLEFLFGAPTLLDFGNHKANLYDEGDNRISSTSMPKIAMAIVAILKNPEATKNKILHSSEVILTQKKLLKIAGELKPDIKWETSNIQTSALLKAGLDAVSSGDFSHSSIMNILGGTAMAGETYGAAYDETDNELLGVTELSEKELIALVAGKLA